MTKQGVVDLYTYLATAWSLVVKPGASEGWKTAKLRELYDSFKDYTDEEVLVAYKKWTEQNDKYPTLKNILNEIAWIRVRKRGPEKNDRYMMERIYDDGNEYVVMVNDKIVFTWDEFINLPCNTEHLDPEEWQRRFLSRRKQILKKLDEKRRSQKWARSQNS